MWFRNSDVFVDDELEFNDEEFPELGGYEVESLCLHEALDRLDRAKDMQTELRSYKELFKFTGK